MEAMPTDNKWTMRWVCFAGVMILSTCLGICQDPSVRIREILAEGLKLRQQGNLEAAQERFQYLLQYAVDNHHLLGQAEAHRCLGLLFNAKADYNRGRAELELALDLHRQVGDHLSIGRTLSALGENEWATGRRTGATDWYAESLAEFEKDGNKEEIARALYNLAFITIGPEKEQKWIPRSLEAARAIGNKRLEGVTYHLWGDRLYFYGDYRQALEKLREALRLLEEAGELAPQAGVFISLGRLYFTHMQSEQALSYYTRALEIARKNRNTISTTYCLRSIGSALDRLGRPDEAMARFEETLAIARQTRSEKLIYEATATLADAFIYRGRYREARDLLTALPDIKTYHTKPKLLCVALYHLGDYQAALDITTTILENAEQSDDEVRPRLLAIRAMAFAKLGKKDESLVNIRNALSAVESKRKQLIPTDYLKQGFQEGNLGLYEAAIDLFHQAGLSAEAFEVAEGARARAFIDLLATRELQDRLDVFSNAGPSESREVSKVESRELRSLASAPSLTALEAQQRAKLLDATLLGYWIGKSGAWIWVVPPEGNIRSVHLETNAEQIRDLIRQTVKSNLGVARRDSMSDELSTGKRSMGRMNLPGRSETPWRDLHQILVVPIQPFLPVGKGKHIVVIPHGPLFGLSFAALRNAQNRYLVEDYTLSYTPSVALLDYSTAGNRSESHARQSYFFVADPQMTPLGPQGKPLPSLPGTLKEARDIAQSLPPDRYTLLSGTSAGESAVRDKLADRQVIHLATHGVLVENRPFESYLALGRDSSLPSGDGRLTASEIYSLRLNADLVVLSACRSGLGSVTGDGVNGLTRAFFYAGTNSVMATLWDVPDQPTNRLIARFYRHYRKNMQKSVALRLAQLELLHALRSGEIVVDTALGKVKLPEDPILWAGFILIGKL